MYTWYMERKGAVVNVSGKLLYRSTCHIFISFLFFVFKRRETCTNGNAKFRSLNSTDTGQIFSGAAWYEHDSSNGKSQFFGKPRKKQLWGRCWAKVGFRKTQADVKFEAARFRVPYRNRSTKLTTAFWIMDGVRSLGAPTHPTVTVFTQWPVKCGGSWPGV